MNLFFSLPCVISSYLACQHEPKITMTIRIARLYFLIVISGSCSLLGRLHVFSPPPLHILSRPLLRGFCRHKLAWIPMFLDIALWAWTGVDIKRMQCRLYFLIIISCFFPSCGPRSGVGDWRTSAATDEYDTCHVL
ncbi:hypothetical protein JB92DRAFT_2967285 [Gautieria morchelliformis]|nr:hypothetical protein JB92DRAFT_2967285 [Gautieria morchelliformis]